MEEQQKIDQQGAIQMLKQGKSIKGYKIEFSTTKVEAIDAILLGKNGIRVPEELIWYDDDKLNFEDDPDITDADFEEGRLTRVLNVEIPVDKEISDWIREEEININELVRNLIQGFYKTLKSIPK